MSCLHVGDDDPDLPRGEPPLLPSCSRQRERACEPRGLEELRSVAVGHAKPNAHPRRHRYGSVGRPLPRGVECCKGCCRSEEHTSELQSLMRISYAVFCLKKKK